MFYAISPSGSEDSRQRCCCDHQSVLARAVLVSSCLGMFAGLFGCALGHSLGVPTPRWGEETQRKADVDQRLVELDRIAAQSPIPKSAFPVLVELCGHWSPEISKRATILLGQVPSFSSDDAGLILSALGKVGHLTPEGVEREIELREKGQVYGAGQIEIAERLRGLGVSAVPRLIQALKLSEEHGLAIDAIALLGPSAEAAIPALMAEVECEDWHFRVEGSAEFALSHIGPGAVPALVRATKSERWWVRQAALDALAKMLVVHSRDLASFLSTTLGDSSRDVRLWTVGVLASSVRKRSELVPVLQRAANDEMNDVGEQARRALEQIGAEH